MKLIVPFMLVIICALVLSPALAETAGDPVIMAYVDYDAPFDEMLYEGFYGYVSPEVTPEHFPPTESGVHCLQYDFYLVEFTESSLSNLSLLLMELPVEFVEKGYRFGNSLELLSLGANYPNLQIDGPIIALGGYWFHHHCGPHPLALVYRDGQRELEAAHLWRSYWIRTVRILIVRDCPE